MLFEFLHFFEMNYKIWDLYYRHFNLQAFGHYSEVMISTSIHCKIFDFTPIGKFLFIKTDITCIYIYSVSTWNIVIIRRQKHFILYSSACKMLVYSKQSRYPPRSSLCFFFYFLNQPLKVQTIT